MPQRIWSIEEQVVHEKVTGFVLEFTSAPTEHDDSTVIMNLWNEGRTRKLSLTFGRGGWLDASKTDVVGMSGAATMETTAGQGSTPVEKLKDDPSNNSQDMDRPIANEPGVRHPLPNAPPGSGREVQLAQSPEF